jgi:hypothetical protein
MKLMRGAHASGQDASSANDRFPAVKLSIAGELNSRRTGMAGSCRGCVEAPTMARIGPAVSNARVASLVLPANAAPSATRVV